MEQALVAELARLRVLVQTAVLGLAQGREPTRKQELAAVPESPQSQGPAVEPQLEREPPVVWVLEQVRQQEPAAVLEQARELRVSRQQEQQQHRLQAAAQELPPYLPALPMKAPY